MENSTNPVKVTTMKRMNLRDIWTNEAASFTPWLAENIHLLGEAIGTQLDIQGQERAIGIFRADIVASDALTGEAVLIENQIEQTDHSHLGQLLTYAAGLQAATIVWIAGHFCDEHRAALDWLNQITTNGMRFFGIEIELWSVDSSTPAARFNVVCKPNVWKKRFSSSGASERAEAYILDCLSKEIRPSITDVMAGANVSRDTAIKTRNKLGLGTKA